MERERGDRAGGTAAGAPPLGPSAERAGGRGSQHRVPSSTGPGGERGPKQTPPGGPARPGWPALAAWPWGTERALLGELLRPGGDLAAGPAASECGAGRGWTGDPPPPLTLMCFLTVSVRSRRSSSGIPISSQMSRSAAMARFRHDTASAANTSLRAPGPAGHQQPPDGARSPPRPPSPAPRPGSPAALRSPPPLRTSSSWRPLRSAPAARSANSKRDTGGAQWLPPATTPPRAPPTTAARAAPSPLSFFCPAPSRPLANGSERPSGFLTNHERDRQRRLVTRNGAARGGGRALGI